MHIENNNTSIKDEIIIIIKESLKFAIVAVIVFFVLGTPLLYLFIKFAELDIGMAGFLTGAIVAILIVVIDEKKIHTNDKMVECNRRIIRKVLKYKFGKC
jgi:ABC-type Fe3+-siderophore transport system permease subunit